MIGYITACLVAMVTTSIVLHLKHGRHPFGDEKAKAIGWWLGLAVLDACIAALLLTGAFGGGSFDELRDGGGLLRGALVGLFGPLAFRSPVRRVRIGGRPENVGVTYVYDRVRIYLERGLDERVTRLRRFDRNHLREQVHAQNWDDIALRGRLEEHIGDLKTLDPTDRERIHNAIRAAMTLPVQGRVPALIKIALDERFAALLHDLKTSEPSEDDRRRGRDAEKEDSLRVKV